MKNSFKSKLLALTIVLFLPACDVGSVWPESGRSDIVEMIQKRNFAFDCYQSKWVEENSKRLKRLAALRSLGTNEECKFDSEDIYWREFSEVINATLRCEKDDIIGEYTISIFKSKNTSYGDYFCNSAHFPSTEEHNLGSVTETLKTPY